MILYRRLQYRLDIVAVLITEERKHSNTPSASITPPPPPPPRRLGMVEWTSVYSSKFLRFCTSLAFPIGTCFASFRFNAIIDAFTSGICNNRNDPISRRKSSPLPCPIGGYCGINYFISCNLSPVHFSYFSSSSIHICFSYFYTS